MGQQQLLLLVLGVVIVGLAVVVGINAFGENQKRANADALVNDAVRLASDIQVWAQKPSPFGGAGGWANIGDEKSTHLFDDLGYPHEGGTYENVNGLFTMVEDGGDVNIRGWHQDLENEVLITVCGIRSDHIATAVNYQLGEEAGTFPECEDDEGTT